MRSSKELQELLKKEAATQKDLALKLENARRESQEAEDIRASLSYDALTRETPAALKKLTDAEVKISQAKERGFSIQSALEESNRISALLQDELKAALDEEKWNGEILEPLKREIVGNAVYIEKHFVGSDEGIPPLIQTIKNHATILNQIDATATELGIGEQRASALFKIWLDFHFHRLFERSNPGMNLNTEQRERFSREYVPLLKEHLQSLVAKREAKKTRLAA